MTDHARPPSSPDALIALAEGLARACPAAVRYVQAPPPYVQARDWRIHYQGTYIATMKQVSAAALREACPAAFIDPETGKVELYAPVANQERT